MVLWIKFFLEILRCAQDCISVRNSRFETLYANSSGFCIMIYGCCLKRRCCGCHGCAAHRWIQQQRWSWHSRTSETSWSRRNMDGVKPYLCQVLVCSIENGHGRNVVPKRWRWCRNVVALRPKTAYNWLNIVSDWHSHKLGASFSVKLKCGWIT